MRLNRYLKSMLAILALGAGMSAPTLAQAPMGRAQLRGEPTGALRASPPLGSSERNAQKGGRASHCKA